jgi:hypothetical protein
MPVPDDQNPPQLGEEAVHDDYLFYLQNLEIEGTLQKIVQAHNDTLDAARAMEGEFEAQCLLAEDLNRRTGWLTQPLRVVLEQEDPITQAFSLGWLSIKFRFRLACEECDSVVRSRNPSLAIQSLGRGRSDWAFPEYMAHLDMALKQQRKVRNAYFFVRDASRDLIRFLAAWILLLP